MSTQINESSCAGAVVDPSSGSAPSPAVFQAAPLGERSEPEASIAIHKSAPQSLPVRDPRPLHPGNQSNNNNNNNKNHRNKRRRRGKQEPPSKAPPEGCSVCKIVKDDEPPKYKCPKCRAPYCSVACCRQHKTICPGKVGESSLATAAAAISTAAASTAGATKSASAQNQTAPINPTNGDGSESDTDDDSDDDDDDSSLEDGWKITDDMKVALRNSTWLRTELQDGGLRDMIASVVRSEKKFKSFHRRQEQGRYRNKNNRNNNNKHGMGKNHPKKQNYQPQPRHPHEELGAKRADNKNFDIFVDKLLVLADVLERQRHDGSMEFATGEATTSGGMSSNRNEEELEEWLRRKWEPGMAPPSLTLRPRQKAIPKFEPIDVSSSSDDEDDVSGDESLESNEDADAKRD